jgi:hypothetical protein
VLVFSRDQQGVEEIERRRPYGHHRLGRPRDRRRNVLDFEVVGAAEAAAQDGFHG